MNECKPYVYQFDNSKSSTHARTIVHRSAYAETMLMSLPEMYFATRGDFPARKRSTAGISRARLKASSVLRSVDAKN